MMQSQDKDNVSRPHGDPPGSNPFADSTLDQKLPATPAPLSFQANVPTATNEEGPKTQPTLSTKKAQQKDGRTLDDMDMMLLHQDFPKLLELSAQVKVTRNRLISPPANRVALSALKPEDVQKAVDRMKERLVTQFPAHCHQTVLRGDNLITDMTIDDAINVLQRELDHLINWEKKRDERRARINAASDPKKKNAKKKSAANGKAKEAIASKYSKWQTDILMNWMIENVHHPFPDQAEVKKLMGQTGLTNAQVVNWTTNVRKRNKKATCENQKKPHHFIDFMFLAQQEEAKGKVNVVRNDHSSHVRSASSPEALRNYGVNPGIPISPASDAPDEAISQSTYLPYGVDDFEPIPIKQFVTDHDVMQKFATLWLNNNNASNEPDSGTKSWQDDSCEMVRSGEGTTQSPPRHKRDRASSMSDFGDDNFFSQLNESAEDWAIDAGISFDLFESL